MQEPLHMADRQVKGCHMLVFPVDEEDSQEKDCHNPYMEAGRPIQAVQQLHGKPKT